MLPERVSNPGPLTYESGALPIALRGPAACKKKDYLTYTKVNVVTEGKLTLCSLLRVVNLNKHAKLILANLLVD